MDLPLDIKFKIASFDEDVWIKLAYIDDEFKQFSYKDGRKIFIDLFTIIIESDTEKIWNIFDKIQRPDDKPATISHDGVNKRWYKNGILHRDNDLPAVVSVGNGLDLQWCYNGKTHRENDKPAYMSSRGIKMWFYNGQFHRENDKPAIIRADGTQEWYQNGKMWRSDGKPVKIDPDGTQHYIK